MLVLVRAVELEDVLVVAVFQTDHSSSLCRLRSEGRKDWRDTVTTGTVTVIGPWNGQLDGHTVVYVVIGTAGVAVALSPSQEVVAVIVLVS